MTICSECHPDTRVSSVTTFSCGHTFYMCCLIRTQRFVLHCVCSECCDPDNVMCAYATAPPKPLSWSHGIWNETIIWSHNIFDPMKCLLRCIQPKHNEVELLPQYFEYWLRSYRTNVQLKNVIVKRKDYKYFFLRWNYLMTNNLHYKKLYKIFDYTQSKKKKSKVS